MNIQHLSDEELTEIVLVSDVLDEPKREALEELLSRAYEKGSQDRFNDIDLNPESK
jgi:hypothetical protein